VKQILFIHSAGPQDPGNGSSALIAHLKNSLNGHFNIIAPMMPDPEHPSYALWKMKLEKEFARADNDVVLIGHSLGGSVLLKYLSEEEVDKKIKALFVIASPFWGKENWRVKDYILDPDFGNKISNLVAQIYFYHSHDDELVPFDHLRQYQKRIPKAVIRAVNNGGHCFDKYDLSEFIADIHEASV
jgi:uncharacterized protein